MNRYERWTRGERPQFPGSFASELHQVERRAEHGDASIVTVEAPHDWYQAKTLRQLGALLDQFKAEGRLESESHYLSVQKPFILPGYGQFIVKGQPQDVVDFFEQATNHAVF